MNIIEISNISKTYPGKPNKANDDISLSLRKGEILCVAGENGAGKTTLMKILCGLEKQDTGFTCVNGNIGMVHQHFMLFPEYTAAENIVIGFEPKIAGFFLDKKKSLEISEKIISENNFSIKSNVKVKELTLGEMQQVEICRILYRNSDIIILDEPTSILTETETNSLFNTLKTLSSCGKSIIIITHKLDEIKRISDRVAVLRKGKLTGISDTDKIDKMDIARMMINTYTDVLENGNKNEGLNPPVKKDSLQEPVLKFDNVSVYRKGQKRPLLDNISFSVNEGEILAFTGVGGNGLGVIEAVMGGFLHPAAGRITLKGRDITHLSSRELRKQGLSYVPANRKNVGSAQNATIKENLIINHGESYESLLEKYNVKFSNINDKAYTLSGGNLQKLILAREISGFRDYIVFSEPTWGLDIAAGKFVMNEIMETKKKGAAIILISTNLEETLFLSDRIIVMYRGKIAGVVINDGASDVKEKIGKFMQGII